MEDGMMSRGAATRPSEKIKSFGKKEGFLHDHYPDLKKCTMCNYNTHSVSCFQRHLMKRHGVKIAALESNVKSHYSTLGRVSNNYGIANTDSSGTLVENASGFCVKFAEKQIFNFECPTCHTKFPRAKQLSFHKKSCKKKFKRAQKLGLEETFFCPNCDRPFIYQRELNKHLKLCGKEKNLWCLICAFKCFEFHIIERHMIDKHNLIAKLVKEPDFEQALNCTPYTVERAQELESLSDGQTVKGHKNTPEKMSNYETGEGNDYEDGNNHEEEKQPNQKPRANHKFKKGRPIKKGLFQCKICKREFTRQKHLNHHRKIEHGIFQNI